MKNTNASIFLWPTFDKALSTGRTVSQMVELRIALLSGEVQMSPAMIVGGLTEFALRDTDLFAPFPFGKSSDIRNS